MIFCCKCCKQKYYFSRNIAASLHYIKGTEFWTSDPKSDLAVEYFRTRKNILEKLYKILLCEVKN
jgi:hypothetical protein